MLTGNARGRHSFSGKSSEDLLNASANSGKPFGIGKFEVSGLEFQQHKNEHEYSPRVFVTLKIFFCFVFYYHRVKKAIQIQYTKESYTVSIFCSLGSN